MAASSNHGLSAETNASDAVSLRSEEESKMLTKVGKTKNLKNSKDSKKKKKQKKGQKLQADVSEAALRHASVAKEGTGRARTETEVGLHKKLSKRFYEQELSRLQTELVKLQYWVKHTGLRVAILFEGRDAAGKGSSIKRIVDCLNPRGCRVVALGKPSDVEKTQWYFQRYVAHLPAAGEIVLFDRSWYNRAGVERVMGFCSEAEYQEFMQSCPEFERMLVRSGIIVLKYWFSVSDEEQERRFQARVKDPAKRWKLSPMDLESRDRWEEYSLAKDTMFAHTNIPEAPWFTVEADDKKRARLNLLNHILSKIPYQDITPEEFELPPRTQPSKHYARPPINEQFFVPQFYP